MTDRVLEDIKDRVDVVDLISSYVQLKKAGANYKGICPFHNEKTGSLMVSPSKQIWHCFGCSLGGDIFEFVKRIENIEFRDALKILADRAGVVLPEYKVDKQSEDKRAVLLRINAFASEYYHKTIFSSIGKEALSYLLDRGLTEQTIKFWKIGFAPEDYQALENALISKGVKTQDMVEAGVSAKSERGRTFDRFRARITFPIFNYMGECVGFSARILPVREVSPSAHSTNAQGGERIRTTSSGFSASVEQAKYINSPETLIYNKSKVLFGLAFAKNDIRKKDYTIVVEGQMDCIKVHQAGFSNTVATSGTALTEDQLRILKRLSNNIVFCFDNDEAGKNALKRVSGLVLNMGFSAKVLVLGEAKDPDELISKDKEAFTNTLKNSKWLIDYFIDIAQRDFTPLSIEQKKFVTTEIMPLLNKLAGPTGTVEREHFLEKITSNFSISQSVLKDLLKQTKVVSQQEHTETNLESEDAILEKEILGGVLYFEHFREQVTPDIQPQDFKTEAIKEFFEALHIGSLTPAKMQDFVNSTLAKEAIFMVESRLIERQQNKEAVVGELLTSFYLFRLNSVKLASAKISVEIKHSEHMNDADSLSKLTLQYQELIQLRNKYEKFLR